MTVSVASRVRLLGTVALAVLMAGGLAGCKTIGSTDTTGSISGPVQRSEADWRRESETLGERFRANPRDADNAIRYAQALRATGQRAQAAAVLETAAIHNPEHKPLLGAYGRALADAGNFKQALERARARPFARPAGLAHPLGAGRRARPDGPPRGGAALLRERAQDRARRAVGAVQSRPVLRALEGPAARRGDAAARRRARQHRQARAAEPGAGGRPARPLPGSRDDRARRPAARRGGRERRLSAPHDGGPAEAALRP